MIFFVVCSVLLKAEKLLLLSDVAFLSTNVNYFKSIAKLAILQKTESPSDSDFEETLTAGTATLLASTASTELEPAKKEVTKAKKPLPRLKVEANIKEFRVAIIEAVDEPQPQALTLKVVICQMLVPNLLLNSILSGVNLCPLSTD